MLPTTNLAGPFWTGGAAGQLRINACSACRRLLHPSTTVCPDCDAGTVSDVAVSGAATIVTHTVNHQRWPVGDREPPYVIAIVAIAEDPRVRLTTAIVGMAPQDVVSGMRVQAQFEPFGDDAWLPVFSPTSTRDGQRVLTDEPPPTVRVRPPASKARFEHRVALTGVGASARGRHLAEDHATLTSQACRVAVADAGLTLEDIDGLATYPGTSGMPGVSDGGARAIEQALNLRPTWHCGAHETPGQIGMVIEAMLAVASGLCRHALCVNTVATGALPTLGDGRGLRGELQWRVPYGAISPANWIALYANRYLEQYGASREALGWIALTERAHAAANPEALFTEPLTMDDYLAARTVSSPFGLYDCDVPCDGAIAVVVSDRSHAASLRHPPIAVDSVGTQISEPQSWDQGSLTHQPNVFGPAAHLWSRAGLRPSDVDLALLYDGFTFNVLTWLEALGFCSPGEGWAFVEGGRRIALGGELPLNPHGGQLSAGRSNGYGGLREAILQLRGHAGSRQVIGAEVAVVSAGGGIPGGCMLLTVDR
jgi:acetyl-CoA acetyltransferase/uncharacterized OB-fold protein